MSTLMDGKEDAGKRRVGPARVDGVRPWMMGQVLEPKTKVDLTRYTEEHDFFFDEVLGEECSNQQVRLRDRRDMAAAGSMGGGGLACGRGGAKTAH
jgi:hypothetical protein